MLGVVEDIFVAPEGSVAMSRVPEVGAVAGAGLTGDRYARRTGHWSGGNECQLTLVEAEALDAIARETGLAVHDGQHRRNVVTRGVSLDDLAGTRFRVGEALLAYERPRPPCRHVEELSERGLLEALSERGGICARVLESGLLEIGACLEIEALPEQGFPGPDPGL